jgi:hypothetical protein
MSQPKKNRGCADFRIVEIQNLTVRCLPAEYRERLAQTARSTAMIEFLARLFRGLHYIIGISEPPPDTSDRKFVFTWLGGIAFVAAFFVGLVFIIPFLYFRH